MKKAGSLIEAAYKRIPSELRGQSGKVFYSGRDAFCKPASLYVLGVNPGGDPNSLTDETVSSHTKWVLDKAPADWSAYRDESWKAKLPGRHTMQQRLLYMFDRIGLNPGTVPASNLVFVRSRREGDLGGKVDALADACWPFHACVIEALRPRAILCLGQTAGDYVRARVGADRRYATFTERNDRQWQSHAYSSPSGLKIIVATHPSVAKWVSAESDPTGLVSDALSNA
jgi:hypothetical protein